MSLDIEQLERFDRALDRPLRFTNEAMVWMDYIEELNELCYGTCFPYEIPTEEIPPILRETV